MPITILAGRSEVRIPEKGQKIILFSKKRPDGLCSPSSLLFNWYRENFQGAEWPGCKVSHSSPSSAPRLRMCETIPLLPPPNAFMTWIGKKLIIFFIICGLLGRNWIKILYALNLSAITTKIKAINVFVTVVLTKIFSHDPSNI